MGGSGNALLFVQRDLAILSDYYRGAIEKMSVAFGGVGGVGGTRNVISFSEDKKNQLDVTFSILYFSSNSCSTCFGQPCAHHQELTTA